MPTFVFLDNYRGFNNAFVPIKRVNFLVGENSTGKTSFLELLETLSYPPFWLFEPRFGVPGSHQRHFLDLVSAASRRRTSFSIGAIALSKDGPEKDRGMVVTYSSLEGRPVPRRVSIVDGETVRTVDGQLWNSKKGERYRARSMRCPQSSNSTTLADRAAQYVSTHKAGIGFVARKVSEELQSSPLFVRCEVELFGEKSGDGYGQNIDVPFPFSSNFVDFAPIRSRPRRTYDAPQTEFSPEGDHTPYIIKRRLASKSQADQFKKFLEKAGAESGLFQSLQVKAYGRGPLAPFELQIVLGKSALGLENVGYGVSQSLPVMVEMFVRPKSTAFTIQQPEVHLHPRAQAAFGDLVAELARTDEKRFIIETHSDFCIDRFRLNIKTDGAIPSQLLFFERTETGNRATAIRINADGSLDESQPDSYRAFFLNESLALLS